MKNLLISPVGDNSLHRTWLRDKANFDSYLIYYGNDSELAKKYEVETPFFTKAKGTKFNLLKQLIDSESNFFSVYDYVFVPNDDLYLNTKQVNHLFEVAQQYKLDICQPSLMGYYDVPITLNVPSSLLRYTNYVEVMCPCFSQEALKKCAHTFDHTVSCWGIDLWWSKILGDPKDKMAIIDDVIAIHTRTCFSGDFYSNNGIVNPWQDIENLVKEFDLNHNRTEYSRVWKDNWSHKQPSERYHPQMPFMPNLCETLRKKWTS